MKLTVHDLKISQKGKYPSKYIFWVYKNGIVLYKKKTGYGLLTR